MAGFLSVRGWCMIAFGSLLVLSAACGNDKVEDGPSTDEGDVLLRDVDDGKGADGGDGDDATRGVPLGETCPEECENSSPDDQAWVELCEGCSEDYCYSYTEDRTVQSYCVRRCETDADCESVGENWFCHQYSCLHEDSW